MDSNNDLAETIAAFGEYTPNKLLKRPLGDNMQYPQPIANSIKDHPMTDLTTLSTLLGSQEARDAARRVEPVGLQDWQLLRCGRFFRAVIDRDDGFKQPVHKPFAFDRMSDCIWSGDLPALLSALVAERNGLQKALLRIGRGAELQAAVMRDPARTGAWHGAEAVASAFEDISERALQALKEQQP